MLTHKYYEGRVPKAKIFSAEDDEVLRKMIQIPKNIGQAIENYRFREASQILMQLARLGNKYLADAEPWKLVKTNPDRVASIMHTALQISAGLAVISEPILPFTANKLKDMLNLKAVALKWDDITQKRELIPAGHKIKNPQLLFQKIEDTQVEKQRSKLNFSVGENKSISPLKPKTSFKITLNFFIIEIGN